MPDFILENWPQILCSSVSSIVIIALTVYSTARTQIPLNYALLTFVSILETGCVTAGVASCSVELVPLIIGSLAAVRTTLFVLSLICPSRYDQHGTLSLMILGMAISVVSNIIFVGLLVPVCLAMSTCNMVTYVRQKFSNSKCWYRYFLHAKWAQILNATLIYRRLWRELNQFSTLITFKKI